MVIESTLLEPIPRDKDQAALVKIGAVVGESSSFSEQVNNRTARINDKTIFNLSFSLVKETQLLEKYCLFKKYQKGI